MTSRVRIKLYSTLPHECSYLPDRQATSVFVDPEQPMTPGLLTRLSLVGFRRSGNHVYRPSCADCKACIAVRIPVERFQPNRSQRRNLAANADLSIHWVDDIDTVRHYRLYEDYIHSRHADGDMFPPSREQYRSFLLNDWCVTQFLELRAGNDLIGVAVVDRLDDGLSAVYTFFSTQYAQRGLGVWAIQQQIELTRELGLPYLYLGYWIRDCDKMRYKLNYRPIELLIEDRWVPLT
ncbi:MAG: arginyltransferase [Pseudomonadota bacterium]|nr:arginyltransferase [Pseudomonadota bacterium]